MEDIYRPTKSKEELIEFIDSIIDDESFYKNVILKKGDPLENMIRLLYDEEYVKFILDKHITDNNNIFYQVDYWSDKLKAGIIVQYDFCTFFDVSEVLAEDILEVENNITRIENILEGIKVPLNKEGE
jgi:flagellin-specific chaperone FliS